MTYECKSDLLRFLGKHNDYGPTILRIFFGFFIMMHGMGKLWGPNVGMGPGLQGWLGWMSSMGVPTFLAYIVPFVEFFGGIFLILGLWTRYWSILGGIVMLTATFMVHLPSEGGFFSAETALLNFGVFLSLVFMGSGRVSLEHAMAKCMHEKKNKKK